MDPFTKTRLENCDVINQVKLMNKIKNDPFNAKHIYRLFHEHNREELVKHGSVDVDRLLKIHKKNSIMKLSCRDSKELDLAMSDFDEALIDYSKI